MINKNVELNHVLSYLLKIQMIHFVLIGFGPAGHNVLAAVEVELNLEVFDVLMDQKTLTLKHVLMVMTFLAFIVKNPIWFIEGRDLY